MEMECQGKDLCFMLPGTVIAWLAIEMNPPAGCITLEALTFFLVSQYKNELLRGIVSACKVVI
jgi:hypothetical protein